MHKRFVLGIPDDTHRSRRACNSAKVSGSMFSIGLLEMLLVSSAYSCAVTRCGEKRPAKQREHEH